MHGAPYYTFIYMRFQERIYKTCQKLKLCGCIWSLWASYFVCHWEKQNRVKIDVNFETWALGVEWINSRKRTVITTAAACFGETALPTHVRLFILFADSVIYMTSRSV